MTLRIKAIIVKELKAKAALTVNKDRQTIPTSARHISIGHVIVRHVRSLDHAELHTALSATIVSRNSISKFLSLRIMSCHTIIFKSADFDP